MHHPHRASLWDFLLLIAFLLLAGGVRAGHVYFHANAGRDAAALRVQKIPTEQAELVRNLRVGNEFKGKPPFAEEVQETAHLAPGYPWLLGLLTRAFADDDEETERWRVSLVVRWVQVLLGTLTAGLYFLFARRVFRHRLVSVLVGLLTALYPFWVINTAELADGVLTTFLLALSLYFGVRTSQTSEPFGSFLYGLTLAGLALVRAALLPFAFVALAWLLLRSRWINRGWLCALLAFLGFANGQALWTVRNIQLFQEPLPVVSSTYYHLWVGNNAKSDGGPATQAMLDSAPSEVKEPQSETERYRILGKQVWDEVREHPTRTMQRRLSSTLAFLFGTGEDTQGGTRTPVHLGWDYKTGSEESTWLQDNHSWILTGALLGMLLFAFFGWRWTYPWRTDGMLAVLAIVWIPIPYILGHAGTLSGPRLPLDGVLLCCAAYALACFLPGTRDLREGVEPHSPDGEEA